MQVCGVVMDDNDLGHLDIDGLVAQHQHRNAASVQNTTSNSKPPLFLLPQHSDAGSQRPQPALPNIDAYQDGNAAELCCHQCLLLECHHK